MQPAAFGCVGVLMEETLSEQDLLLLRAIGLGRRRRLFRCGRRGRAGSMGVLDARGSFAECGQAQTERGSARYASGQQRGEGEGVGHGEDSTTKVAMVATPVRVSEIG